MDRESFAFSRERLTFDPFVTIVSACVSECEFVRALYLVLSLRKWSQSPDEKAEITAAFNPVWVQTSKKIAGMIAGMKHFLKCKLFSVRRVSGYNPPVDQKISFVLVMNETLFENNIVSLRLNYLLSTRQFVRDAFYLFNVWFREAPFRECEQWQTLAIKKVLCRHKLVQI